MTGPIISPWIFYFIGMLTYINVINVPIFVISTFATVIFFARAYISNRNLKIFEAKKEEYNHIAYDKEIIVAKQDLKGYKKLFKFSLVVFILSFLIFIFIPSEGTAYKMLVADNLTYENVDALGENAKNTVDYIFDKIEEVQNGSTESEGE